MAAILKCTRIENRGNSPLVAGAYLFFVTYHNPTIPNPPDNVLSFSLPKEDASVASEIMDSTDAVLSGLGTNTMDWTI